MRGTTSQEWKCDVGGCVYSVADKADPSKAKAMPAGSFVVAPGTRHFVAAAARAIERDDMCWSNEKLASALQMRLNTLSDREREVTILVRWGL